MRKRAVLMVLGVLAILATVLGIASFDAYAVRPPKLVVRQIFGPFGVEPGHTVHLAAFNLLPGMGGGLTFTVLDGVTGDLQDEATFVLDPRSGENFTVTVANPGSLLAVVRFESGDVSAVRGPALATSVQVLDDSLGTRMFATAAAPPPERRGDRT